MITMTDLQTMKNVLVASGYREDSFTIVELKDTIELTLYKSIYLSCGCYDEIETTFVYDKKNEKLIEIY
jgi:hypothetical protein